MSASEPPTVLLVDDEPRVLSALRRGLRREGFRIETADSAKQALDRLAGGAVELVISDHRMPGMSGTELLAVVRRRWPKTARLLLSGWSSEITPGELSAAAPQEVLDKPWNDAELRAAIRRALGRD